MLKFKKYLSASLIWLLLTAGEAVAIVPTPKPQKPVCRLEVQNAHLSTTLQRHRDLRVLKVNVSSICNVEQTKVLITLEIHKKGEFGDHVYGPFTNKQSTESSSGLIVKLQDKYITCINRNLTYWFGVAFSKAFIAGRWQYARATQSSEIEPLACGT